MRQKHRVRVPLLSTPISSPNHSCPHFPRHWGFFLKAQRRLTVASFAGRSPTHRLYSDWRSNSAFWFVYFYFYSTQPDPHRLEVDTPTLYICTLLRFALLTPSKGRHTYLVKTTNHTRTFRHLWIESLKRYFLSGNKPKSQGTDGEDPKIGNIS